MATDLHSTSVTGVSPQGDTPALVPELHNGDCLSRDEFERRYEAMPGVKKAELIEGVVYMGSPVSTTNHGVPHAELIGWIATYVANTPGTQVADNATIRLDGDNEPQPDVFLRVLPDHGGRTRQDGKYTGGGPELVCEVASSSVSIDLHQKKKVYRRSGVQEYLVWRVDDRAIDWFALQDGEFVPLPRREDGLIASVAFPGLWLDADALLAGDLKRVLAAVTTGVASADHKAFAKRLQERAAT